MLRPLIGAVTTFLAVGVLAVPAGPARAAERKFRVEMSSGTIAVGAGHKDVTFTVTNISGKTQRKPVLSLDHDSFEWQKVAFPLNTKLCKAVPIELEVCALSPDPLPAGRSAKLTLRFEVRTGAAPGPAGEVAVSVTSAGSPAEMNKFPLTVSAKHGPDLFIRAKDVTGTAKKVSYVLGNNGDAPVKNVQVRITLPQGVTAGDGCRRDDKGAICDFAEVIAPHATREANFPIAVDEDAETGAQLSGQIEIVHSEADQAPGPDAVNEIDEADNRDRFQMLIPTKGQDGPTLPITGPVATPIAGLAAALIAAGGLLLAMTRRRFRARRD